jgi:hypothetical protein
VVRQACAKLHVIAGHTGVHQLYGDVSRPYNKFASWKVFLKFVEIVIC